MFLEGETTFVTTDVVAAGAAEEAGGRCMALSFHIEHMELTNLDQIWYVSLYVQLLEDKNYSGLP